MRHWLLPVLALTLAACSGTPKKPTPPVASRTPSLPPPASASVPKRSPYAPAQEDPSKRGDYTRGGLYAPHIRDSAPDVLPDVELIPEPEVRAEPRSRYGNRSPYAVLGKSYSVLPSSDGYLEQGLASYYGSKFHGRRTSNQEVYDMYTFSAAHKTLPLPSYARVTNLANGKSVVVRINDRGPFHEGRIIDLSYAAAVKLGVHRTGTAPVEVRGLSPGEQAHAPYDAIAVTGPLPAAALPPGVRIATGQPQPAAPSPIDTLVAALPGTGPATSEPLSAATSPSVVTISPLPTMAVPAAASGNNDWRFDMRQDGRIMTADEFDRWMRSRRARVATGRPGTPDPQIASAPMPGIGAGASVPSPPVAQDMAAAAPAPPPGAATIAAMTGAAVVHGDDITLQVAAFAARDNAERALAMLRSAGIADARLLDADADGRKLWRLRVGPVERSASQELAARIAGLGFGQPQPVRE